MFGAQFQRRYALSDKGVATVKKGTFWTIIVNLTVMGGTGILYVLMTGFIETRTNGAPLPKVGIIIGATVAFLVLSFITHYQQYVATYSLVFKEVKTMRIGLAEGLRKLPLRFFGKRDIADLTETLLSDVNRMEHVWSHVLGYLYGSYISTGLIAVMLFAMDWRLAIACLWGVPLAFALLFGTRRIAENKAEATKAGCLDVADSMQEALENIREIHATNQEERYTNALYAKIDACERLKAKSEFLTGIFVNGASIIMRLGVATTILAGASLILKEEVAFMTLFMFLLVITRIYAPFDQSLILIAEVFLSNVSAKRLTHIYESSCVQGETDFNPPHHDVTFTNVSFAYEDHRVLDEVSFTAKTGEVTALVGPSGSGKTTCARLAARLWDASSGTITVGGIDISGVDPEILLGHYSVVFQDVTLFDNTVMENIRLGKFGATDAQVLAAAKAAQCDDFVTKLPQGYNTLIGENGAKLSGGERQRISIARALLKDAPIVLLDEATASLDVGSETQVQTAVSRLLEGKTVLVIAHRMRTVENADKIIVLREGKVVEEGSPSQLLARPDSTFAQMRALQSTNAQWAM